MKHLGRFLGGFILGLASVSFAFVVAVTNDVDGITILKLAGAVGVLAGIMSILLGLSKDMNSPKATSLGKSNLTKPIIIGDWKSDIVEERSYGKSHYKVQTIAGLEQLLDSVEGSGRGGATLNWWVAGQTVKTSAYIPLEILIKLKNKEYCADCGREIPEGQGIIWMGTSMRCPECQEMRMKGENGR